MEQFIGCDAHKRVSVFVAVNERGHAGGLCEWRTIGTFTASFRPAPAAFVNRGGGQR
jgi:hypothetical protein